MCGPEQERFRWVSFFFCWTNKILSNHKLPNFGQRGCTAEATMNVPFAVMTCWSKLWRSASLVKGCKIVRCRQFTEFCCKSSGVYFYNISESSSQVVLTTKAIQKVFRYANYIPKTPLNVYLRLYKLEWTCSVSRHVTCFCLGSIESTIQAILYAKLQNQSTCIALPFSLILSSLKVLWGFWSEIV